MGGEGTRKLEEREEGVLRRRGRDEEVGRKRGGSVKRTSKRTR